MKAQYKTLFLSFLWCSLSTWATSNSRRHTLPHSPPPGEQPTGIERPTVSVQEKVTPPRLPTAEEKAQIQTLIEQLDAKTYRQRRMAWKQLFDLGDVAVPQLQEALQGAHSLHMKETLKSLVTIEGKKYSIDEVEEAITKKIKTNATANMTALKQAYSKARFEQLETLYQQAHEIREQIKKTEKDEGMTAEEKKEYIDALNQVLGDQYERMIEAVGGETGLINPQITRNEDHSIDSVTGILNKPLPKGGVQSFSVTMGTHQLVLRPIEVSKDQTVAMKVPLSGLELEQQRRLSNGRVAINSLPGNLSFQAMENRLKEKAITPSLSITARGKEVGFDFTYQDSGVTTITRTLEDTVVNIVSEILR